MSRRAFFVKNLYAYGLLFIVTSTFGYLMEVVGTSILNQGLVDRGFLHIPLLPIYGLGSMLIVYLFIEKKFPLIVFFLAIVVCLSLLEYLSGFGLDKIFHQKWWDYSGNVYNLNGYISIWSSIGFGLGGMAVLFFIWPFLTYITDHMKNKVLTLLTIPYLSFILVDFVVSSLNLLN